MMMRSKFYRLNQLVVKNKTKYPVPDYIKKALERNNPDRGIKFTLSNLMNDQMLLGRNKLGLSCAKLSSTLASYSLLTIIIYLDNNLLKKKKGPLERKQGVTINWVCVTQNCYFRATTVNDNVDHTNGLHNHEPNIEEYHKREGRVKLKEAVAVSDVPVSSVRFPFLCFHRFAIYY